MLTAKGIVELKKGESSNARDTFIEATAIERNYSRAYSFMAVSHLHAGEPEIAFRQLELAQSLTRMILCLTSLLRRFIPHY